LGLPPRRVFMWIIHLGFVGTKTADRYARRWSSEAFRQNADLAQTVAKARVGC